MSHAEHLVGGRAVSVIAGGIRRIDTLHALVSAARAPWLILHDVAHPFVTIELSQRVMEEARRSGAATAALSNVDFLYGNASKRLKRAGNSFVAHTGGSSSTMTRA